MIKLNEIKGLGPKTQKILNKLNIETSQDLLEFYPFRYEILTRSNIYELSQDDKIVIDGIVESIPTIRFIGRKMDKMTFQFNTYDKVLNVTIFNRAFLKPKIKPGTILTIIGKYDPKHNSIIASDIKFEKIEDKQKIEPIYHTTSGITSKQIHQYINSILSSEYDIPSYIPDYLLEKYNFINKNKSIKNIHNPQDKRIFEASLNFLKYEELFNFMLRINYLKKNSKKKTGLKRDVDYKKVEDLIHSLPFELTKDQLKAIENIYDDLICPKRMNRLLQGDVGSGKTIVSFIAMYINYLSGYQSALMAPTEILANQHYENIKKLFKDINIGLLTGKTKAKEKKEIYKKLNTGEINIIIGTHALIQEDVIYKNLGLVITDEQHRFGVNQRSNLKNKGIIPDILYMSATPIPRTYALTIYGDMDISSIKTMPKGRKEIKTLLYNSENIKEVLEKMFMELKNKHQVYVIAPLIEESEKSDLENVYALEEKMKKAFGKYFNIGVMHGKMSNDEKAEAMNKFKNNETQILISTTVIEVGVDVKNATMIVVFDSYRFGLSALHQLRGRVGRNNLQSYCILISDKEAERLNILTKTSDGFKVSEEDFKLRGSGDLFGVRQSGDMSFKIANIKNDYSLLLMAKEDSEEFLNSKEYVNKRYDYIRQNLESSMNLD